jgi:hypothetical protein
MPKEPGKPRLGIQDCPRSRAAPGSVKPVSKPRVALTVRNSRREHP